MYKTNRLHLICQCLLTLIRQGRTSKRGKNISQANRLWLIAYFFVLPRSDVNKTRKDVKTWKYISQTNRLWLVAYFFVLPRFDVINDLFPILRILSRFKHGKTLPRRVINNSLHEEKEKRVKRKIIRTHNPSRVKYHLESSQSVSVLISSLVRSRW